MKTIESGKIPKILCVSLIQTKLIIRFHKLEAQLASVIIQHGYEIGVRVLLLLRYY